MTTRSKRLTACLLAITLATAPTASHPANLNAEMQAMFNDLGALGNVTSPGAFRGPVSYTHLTLPTSDLV